MPAIRQIHNSFNAGEVSPKIEARTDLEKYANACNTLENFCILPQGGITGRPGLRYVGLTKTSARRSRLIPFEYSVDDAYILEFGHNYIRPHRNGARENTAVIERITNGSFASGISGWTDYSGTDIPGILYTSGGAGYIWWDSGTQSMGMTSATVAGVARVVGRAGQAITTIVGKTYTLNVITIGGGYATVRVGSTLHASDLVNGQANPTFTTTFVAVGTTTFVELERGGPPCYVDSISILEDAIPLELTTTYTEDELPDIKFAQSADILYIAHPNHPPAKLIRYAVGDWDLEDVVFRPPASSEHDYDWSGGTISLAITKVSTGLAANTVAESPVYFTASDPIFVAGDVGRVIKLRNSMATITALGSTTQVTATILYDFPSATIVAGDWLMTATPSGYLHPSDFGTVGGTVTITTTSDAEGNTALHTWRSGDVGKYVKGNGGFVKILSIGPGLGDALGEVLSPFASLTPIVPGAWSVEQSDWNATFGYPGAVCFFEQRLMLAGTTKKPSTVWGSVTGDYENFRTGTLADDGLAYALASNLVNAIRWMVPARALIIGTAGGEFRAQGGTDSPLTPSNVDIKSETTHGSNRMVPVRIGNSVIFFQRSGKRLRDFLYTIQADGYESSDLTILADHITGDGVTDMDYEQEPLSQIWMVRSDGVLLSITYVKGQQVVGWSRHLTDGLVESVATIPSPSGTGDQTWLIVNRTINGSTVRNIEYLDWNVLTDAAIVQVYASPTTAVSGLSHLEGCTVSVIADGEQVDGAIVSSGAITLAVAASNVEVGLPFTPKIVTARPEVPSSTIQGLVKRWVDCFVRVYQTRGLTINDQPQEDTEAVTTDIKVVNLGYDRDGRITIEQSQAYRATILSVFGTLSVGD